MKNFLRKTLIYLILSVIAIPASIYSGLATVPKVEAAASIYSFNTESDVPATSGSTFAPFTRTGVSQSTAAGVFNSDHWATTAPLDRGKYISFTVTANPGYRITADSLKFLEKGSNTVANKFMVSYFLDGSAAPNDLAETDVNNTSLHQETFPLSISSVSEMEFRFYVYGDVQADGAGTPTIAGTWRVDDVELDVSVTSLPPTVSLSDDQTDSIVKNGDAVNITATFVDALALVGTPTISIGSIVVSALMTATINPLVWTYQWLVPTGNNGTASIVITAVDLAGNPNTAATGKTSYTIDNTVPVITRIGPAAISLQQFSVYTDAGATATDSTDGDITGRIVATGSVDTKTAGIYTLRYNVSDTIGNQATEVTRTVTVTALNIKNLSEEDRILVISPADPNGTTVNIPLNLTGSTLDLSAILIPGVNNNSATLPNNLVANLATSIGTVQVIFQQGTTITGPSSWDGKLDLPESVINPTVTPDQGETVLVTGNIEIGLANTKLTFDQAVRILMPGQANKLVGFIRNGLFTKISTICPTDSGTSLASADSDCALNVNSNTDLAIWTRHFTQFVVYSQTPIVPAIISATNVQKNGNNYIDVAWNSTGADSYEIYINGILASSSTVTSTESQITAIGQYSVKVRAKVSSSYSDYSNSVTVTVMALGPSTTSAGTADSPSTTASKSTALVSTARAAAPAAVTPAAASDSNGIVKAAEAAPAATTTTNWTPWIVLFILIILAGAVTGGYFYWFAGREELALATNKDVRQVNSLSKNAKETTVTVRDKPKSGDKKPNRW